MHDTQPTQIATKPGGTSPKREVSSEFIEFVRSYHLAGKPSFLIPTKSISPEAATAGKLFHELSNRQLLRPQSFKTFFVSSQYEAFFGTVKIMRANMKKQRRTIGVFEMSDHYAFLCNPFGCEETAILAPGVVFFRDVEKMKKALQTQQIHAIIVHIQSRKHFEIAAELFKAASTVCVLSALSRDPELEANADFSYIFGQGPDIFIYSESFTNWQIPFGCFSMNDRSFQPWNTIQDCLIHSSTYSGNMIALAYAIHCIYRRFPTLPHSSYPSFKDVILGFQKYVNPKAAILYETLNLAPNVVKAKGSWFDVERKTGSVEKVLDCLGNSGCSNRGHNSENLIEKVIDGKVHSKDSIERLQNLLYKLTGLSQMSMTTSGARAVDLALAMANQQLGMPLRVVSFTNNYAGKTLGALSVTFYDGYKKDFRPLYPEVYFVDPFSKNAEEILDHLIEEKEINFAWFELLQGDSLNTIPQTLINRLKIHQERKRILIGVDEILTGCFRTGSFLLSEQFHLKPDFITLSKGLTDLSFPFACVCYSETLSAHPSMETLKIQNANTFGAAVGLNVIEQALAKDLGHEVKKRSDQLKFDLERICSKSKWIRSVKGKGLLLYLEPDERAFPISIFGKDLFGFFLSSYLINQSNIFLLNCRVTPALNLGDKESAFLISQLEKSLSQLTTWRLLRFVSLSIFMIYLKASKYDILRFFRRLKF